MAAKRWIGLLALLVTLAVGWWVLGERNPAPDSGMPAANSITPADAKTAQWSFASTLASPSGKREPVLPEVLAESVQNTVAGTVEKSRRRPVEGATVRLFSKPIDAARALLAETTTDEKGWFRFGIDPTWPADFAIQASLAEHTTDTLLEFETSVPVRLRLDELIPVFGRVTSAVDNSPVVGATVTDGRTDTQTDAAGVYELIAQRFGAESTLTATREGFADQEARIRLLDRRRVRLDIVLRPQVALQFDVVDGSTHLPVAGATVSVGRYAREMLAPSDALGRCAIPVAEGDAIDLTIAAPGYCKTRWQWDRVVVVGDPSPLRVPLIRGAVVEGHIANEAGQPVGNANLRLQHNDRQAAPLDGAQNVPGSVCASHGDGDTNTNKAGDFRMVLVPAVEPYVIHVAHEDYVSAESAPVRAVDAGGVARVHVTLVRGGIIHGTVRKNGKPWRGDVWFRSVSGRRQGRQTAGTDGSFEIRNVPAGEVRVWLRSRLSAAELCPATIRVAVGQRVQHDFSWREELATIAGAVLSHDGKPISGLTVLASSPDSQGFSHGGITDDAGRYSVLVPATGTYEVRVRRGPISRSREPVLPGATDVHFQFPDTGVLRLRLVDATSHEPMAPKAPRDAQPWGVAWRGSGEEVFRTIRNEIDVTGRLELEMPVGLIDVCVAQQRSGYAPTTLLGVRVTTGRSSPEVLVELDRGVATELRVRRPGLFADARAGHVLFLLAQAQVADVRGPFPVLGGPSNHRIGGVNLWVAQPGLLNQMPEFDASGVAKVTGLSPGRYRLVAFPADLVFDPSEFDVDAQSATVELTWRRH